MRIRHVQGMCSRSVKAYCLHVRFMTQASEEVYMGIQKCKSF